MKFLMVWNLNDSGTTRVKIEEIKWDNLSCLLRSPGVKKVTISMGSPGWYSSHAWGALGDTHHIDGEPWEILITSMGSPGVTLIASTHKVYTIESPLDPSMCGHVDIWMDCGQFLVAALSGGGGAQSNSTVTSVQLLLVKAAVTIAPPPPAASNTHWTPAPTTQIRRRSITTLVKP